MKNLNYILQVFLDCGYSDVKFMNDLIDYFDVDVENVFEEIKANESNIKFNTVVYYIYNEALNACGVYDKIDSNNVSIFTNYIDSHLCLITIDGEYVECYCKQDIISFLNKY